MAFLNEWNAQWVAAARRMSPHVLCELLAFTGPQIAQYFASLDRRLPFRRMRAWRLFTKGLPGEEAKRLATLGGDPALYEPFFRTIAVIG